MDVEMMRRCEHNCKDVKTSAILSPALTEVKSLSEIWPLEVRGTLTTEE
jgi:hypothetical protein